MPVEDFFFGGCYFFDHLLRIYHSICPIKSEDRKAETPFGTFNCFFAINNSGFFSKMAKAQRCSYYEKPLLCVFGIINI